MSGPRESCACEKLGHFCSGVPGILAAVQDGRLTPGAVAQRCDLCQQYPSDDAALAKLQTLGLADADAGRPTYCVHSYPVIRVTLRGIAAEDPPSAARRVRDAFDWSQHQTNAEFVEEFSEFLVDFEGAPDFSRSVDFDGCLGEIGADPTLRRAWLLVINCETHERIEVCATEESAFRILCEYVEQHWEGTFGEEPIDRDPARAVQRFFDVGPVGYTLEQHDVL